MNRKRVIGLLMSVVLMLSCVACGLSNREMEDIAASYIRQNTQFHQVTVDSVEVHSNTWFSAECTVARRGTFFDLSGTVRISLTRVETLDGVKWELSGDPIYSNCTSAFHEPGDEYYLYNKGNTTELFQIKEMTENSVRVKVYGHDLDSPMMYAPARDEYYNGEHTWSLRYLEQLQCFEFDYYDVGKEYRIYPDWVEVSFETANVGVRYTDYKRAESATPEDYWWFERAMTSGRTQPDGTQVGEDEPVVEPDTPRPEPQQPEEPLVAQPEVKTVTGDSFSGALNTTEQTDYYSYTAPRTGVYFFALDINDVNKDYQFSIYNSKKGRVVQIKRSGARNGSYQRGTCVSLTEGETYEIRVGEAWSACSYTVAIMQPNAPGQLSGEVSRGTFRFPEQKDIYTFAPAESGTYEFYFGDTKSDGDYTITIREGESRRLISTRVKALQINDWTIELPLTAGQVYTVELEQLVQMREYSVRVSKKAEE